jgi:hypothetical protein
VCPAALKGWWLERYRSASPCCCKMHWRTHLRTQCSSVALSHKLKGAAVARGLTLVAEPRPQLEVDSRVRCIAVMRLLRIGVKFDRNVAISLAPIFSVIGLKEGSK